MQITDLTGSLVFEPASATVVTVNRRDVTVTPADSDIFLYDGNEHAVTRPTLCRAPEPRAATPGLVGEDQLAVTLVGNRRTDAGDE